MFRRSIVRMVGGPWFITAALLVSINPQADAHADLLLQIEGLTRSIASDPRNAQLYLQRGELYRAHAEWETALADFNRALEINPSQDAVDFLKGRVMSDAGWLLSARAYLDRFLLRHPRHSEALANRARVLSRLQMNLGAGDDYTAAIAATTDPIPELFIERAQVLAAEGPGQLAHAVKGLDEGLMRLGPLVTLQLFAIDLELKRANFDSALTRIATIAERSPRKESWLARRGEILVQANRPDQARVAFQAALAALGNLPPARRNVPAMVQLEKRIREQLGALPPQTGQ